MSRGKKKEGKRPGQMLILLEEAQNQSVESGARWGIGIQLCLFPKLWNYFFDYG